MNLFGNIKFKDYSWHNGIIIKSPNNKYVVRRNDKIHVNNYKNAKILAISDNIVLFSAKTNEGDIIDICHISKIKKEMKKGDKIIYIKNGYSVGVYHSDAFGKSLIKINDIPMIVENEDIILYNENAIKTLEKQFKPEPFKNGDKVKCSYGLTFTYIGLDPLDKNYGYFIHPEEDKLDRLPMSKITHLNNNDPHHFLME